MERKKFHEDEKAKNWGKVRKKMTKSLLFCVKIPNTLEYVQEIIKFGVRHQDSVLGGT